MKTSFLKAFLLLISITFLFSSQSFSQNPGKYNRKAKKEINKGNNSAAIFYYQQALKEDSTYYKANIGLGKTYLYTYQIYDSALIYIERAINHPAKENNYIDYFDFANSLRLANRPDEAITWYQKFSDLYVAPNQSTRKELDTLIAQNIRYAKLSKTASNKPTTEFLVENLQFYINSRESEYTPIYDPANNHLIFNARYKDFKNEKQFADYQYMENIYFFDLDEMVSSTYDESIEQDSHNGIVSKTYGSDTILVYYHNVLWTTYQKDGRLQERQALPDKLSDFYFQPHGVFSQDQKSFYFSAKKKPEDNLDLYVSHLTGSNWSNPVKVSPSINSEFDEDSPYLTSDNKTLYFSSKGHNSSGGYDIFESKNTDGTWSTPVALPYPINSPGDDIYYSIDDENKVGYLSSNRSGGFGLMDIYSVKRKVEPNFDCLAESNFNTDLKLTTDRNEYYIGDEVIITAIENEEGETKFTDYYWMYNDSLTNLTGSEFKLKTNSENPINIQVQAFGYIENRRVSYCYSKIVSATEVPHIVDPVDTSIVANNNNNNNNNNNEVEASTINPIYFAFGETTLDRDAQSEMTKLLQLLKANPSYKLKIKGHTDALGESDFNLILSKRRIDATIQFLVKNGINKDRVIETKGVGETEPATPNVLPNGYDNLAGRKLNRRVEFTIIK